MTELLTLRPSNMKAIVHPIAFHGEITGEPL